MSWIRYLNARKGVTPSSDDDDLFTDSLDSTFRLRNAQGSLLWQRVEDIPRTVEPLGNVILPHTGVTAVGSELFVQASPKFKDILEFVGKEFKALVTSDIAGPMAKVIYHTLSSRSEDVVRLDKCNEASSVFLTVGERGVVNRFDFNTVGFPVQSKELQRLSGKDVSTVSIVASTVDPIYVRKNLNDIIERLYPTSANVTEEERKEVKAAIVKALDAKEDTHVAISSSDIFSSSTDTEYNYEITLPIGTAASARAPIEAWFQSYIAASNVQAICTCSQVGDLDSELRLVVQTGGGDDSDGGGEVELEFGWLGLIKDAATALAKVGGKLAINAIQQLETL